MYNVWQIIIPFLLFVFYTDNNLYGNLYTGLNAINLIMGLLMLFYKI